jgi:hypothetical protein
VKERHEIWAVADALQMDLRAAAAKLVELRARLAALDLPGKEATVCPTCGVSCAGPQTLAEHVYTSHGGPTPAHWERIEAMSEELA